MLYELQNLFNLKLIMGGGDGKDVRVNGRGFKSLNQSARFAWKKPG
jgi:hypothetical protein